MVQRAILISVVGLKGVFKTLMGSPLTVSRRETVLDVQSANSKQTPTRNTVFLHGMMTGAVQSTISLGHAFTQ